MDKELIRNRLERISAEDKQLASLHLKLSSCTACLVPVYKNLYEVQNPKEAAAYMMIIEKTELKRIADNLFELAKFISETSEVVGSDADEIINSRKSTDDKQ